MNNSDSEEFKRIVLNPDNIPTDYFGIDGKFSFMTVFYRTPYSYRCCPCAYQHEYFDYLSDNDEIDEQKERLIDEDVFNQIIQNIADGKCPHANEVEAKYLATSSVLKIHVLAVLGLSRKFSWNSVDLSGIFKLRPFVIVALKNSCHIPDFIDKTPDWKLLNEMMRQTMYPIISKETHKVIRWERISFFECCARKCNKKVFEQLLFMLWHLPGTCVDNVDRCDKITKIYDVALKYDHDEVLDALIETDLSIHHLGSHFSKMVLPAKLERSMLGAEAAIVYNCPRILESLITWLEKTNDQIKATLIFICSVLERNECMEVLFKHGFPENVEGLKDQGKQNELLHILLRYSNGNYKEEIQSVMQQYKEIDLPKADESFALRHKDNPFFLNCLLDQQCFILLKSKEFIQLMTIGDKIDLTKLSFYNLDDIFRELVERCLFSNLLNLNSLAEQSVSMYLKQYAETDLKRYQGDRAIDLVFKESHDPGTVGREYIMDAKEHFLFSEENFALNFILPLFIECGFPISRNSIDRILQNKEVMQKIHTTEAEYLIQSLECPRSLQLCCRDSLRRHFKNRQIHRFVSISKVPNKIKDFILLKSVLPTLKYTCWNTTDD